jgi:hypothetical protein
MPSRARIKDTGLPKLKSFVQEKIKGVLTRIRHINTSIDLWSDATMRGFNGYIAQGIDDDWELHTIPIEFENMTGNYNF